jgi:DNA gyrase/topoisomerase IV subunit B
MKWTLGVLLVAVCGFARAADINSQIQQAKICEALANAVEDGVKELAFLRSQVELERSAPRETNQQLEKVVTTNLMQMHLTLMQANKCPLPRTTFADSAYSDKAFACSKALIRAQAGDKAFPEACDRTKWAR